MRLPAELNPRIEEVILPNGNTPIWKIVVTFNGEDHCYEATELSDFAAVNILMKAMADGYGQEWTPPVPQDTPVTLPIEDTPPEEEIANE